MKRGRGIRIGIIAGLAVAVLFATHLISKAYYKDTIIYRTYQMPQEGDPVVREKRVRYRPVYPTTAVAGEEEGKKGGDSEKGGDGPSDAKREEFDALLEEGMGEEGAGELPDYVRVGYLFSPKDLPPGFVKNRSDLGTWVSSLEPLPDYMVVDNLQVDGKHRVLIKRKDLQVHWYMVDGKVATREAYNATMEKNDSGAEEIAQRHRREVREFQGEAGIGKGEAKGYFSETHRNDWREYNKRIRRVSLYRSSSSHSTSSGEVVENTRAIRLEPDGRGGHKTSFVPAIMRTREQSRIVEAGRAAD